MLVGHVNITNSRSSSIEKNSESESKHGKSTHQSRQFDEAPSMVSLIFQGARWFPARTRPGPWELCRSVTTPRHKRVEPSRQGRETLDDGQRKVTVSSQVEEDFVHTK